MSVRQLIRAALASAPTRRFLGAVGNSASGRRLLRGLSAPRAVYESFDEAWKAAGRGRHAGHDHPDAVTLHLELSRKLRPSDYPALFWLKQIPGEQLNVFDFGGNAGNLYYSYIEHLRQRFRECQWTVFDLPKVCAEGERIAKERGARKLCFTQSFRAASSANVVLVSGALHYWEGSIKDFLRQFEAAPQRVLVNRTPIHPRESSFITVQQTERYAVPCIVRNRAEMIKEFASGGYRLVDEWPATELSLRLPLFPDLNVEPYSGFYFERAGAEAG